MGEDGKSSIGATATIIVAIVGLLTAIVNIVPKLLDNIPKEKTEQATGVNTGGGGQQLDGNTSQQTGTAQQQTGNGGLMPAGTDAEKEALKQKQTQLEEQMQEMKKELEAQKKRGNASSTKSGGGGNDDVYYTPPKITGIWYVAGYPGMQYNFSQSGNNIAFTMMYGGMNTGGGQGILSGNIIQFEAMDQQSTWTGSFQLSPDGRSMSGVAYNAYGTYTPINLTR
ncbi:hypothetical protein C7N43_17060 [Sphingobacteriales bacterium UPWRP_1]|nr:hypothetical protein BVG80_12890 [Sphingobacteriales bacterium TSM_CSM]PSJ75784.1 hypothetical protein C7N43_17060 [Sphingobacteriales bacterium UPWRP_1]